MSAKAVLSHFTPSVIVDRLKKIGANRELTRRISGIAARAGRLTLTLSLMPDRYYREDVVNWAAKFERVFNTASDK